MRKSLPFRTVPRVEIYPIVKIETRNTLGLYGTLDKRVPEILVTVSQSRTVIKEEKKTIDLLR